ncbi:MAG TPA: hypothetical protein VGR88_09175, partial [Ktedonobacterales bacterium]|nr:hypothetical protein [Ktedonobacterales bacterium]
RGNVSHGDGVYKSTDGGATWRNVGLSDTRHIGAIAIHPQNPDIVFVAAVGHAWGPNSERGVFRTTDGGKSWQKVLYKSDRAGAPFVSMDPAHPDVLYASIWQAQRQPHALQNGGDDCGLWKTTDGGDTWQDITRNKGLPTGLLGKIGVAASPAQAGRVYALFEAADKDGSDTGGMYRSDDWGETWERLSTELNLRRRPWYYMHVFADPQDADTVWVLNLDAWKSVDGGKTFFSVPTPHGDNHGLWIDPRNSKRRIHSDDGGAYITFDDGRHWSTILNQPTAQFYHVTTDDQIPYYVYGSQQDNWAMRLPSIDFDGAISWKDYVEPGGGESGYIAISRKEPHTVFGGGIGTGPGHGRLIAWNPETRQKRNVTVWPEVLGSGVGADALKYRFQWTFPVEMSPFDDDTLYICSNHVHRSRDEGASWEVISPDLTRNDPEKLRSSGGAITADNSGAEIYCTIFAFRESPHEKGVFWAGSDDGLVHISRDGGASWQNVTPSGLPEWALISLIEPSPHDAATAYLAATRYKHDDNRPLLYKTKDYGANWQLITEGMPAHEFTRVIREDPNKRGLLYAGTETGVFVSFDDGAHWQPLTSNLPVTPIHDLVIKNTDLVAATHGRSFWILDDLTPLYQMTEETAGTAVTLYAPRPTTRFRRYENAPGDAPRGYADYKRTGAVTVVFKHKPSETGVDAEEILDAGKNPPNGVIVHYFLKEKPEKAVTLRFLDADGKQLRSFSSEGDDKPRAPVKPGANRFVWDLRCEPPVKLEGDKQMGPYGPIDMGVTSPRAPSGKYQVELVVGDQTYAAAFEIVRDPRLPVSDEALMEQFTLRSSIRDRLSEISETLNQLRRVRKQVESWEERAKNGEGREQFTDQAKNLKEKLTAIETELINVNADKPQPGPNRLREKLMTLSSMVDESDNAPTQGAREVYAQLAEQTQQQRTAFRAVLDEDVPAFNKAVAALKLPLVGA